MVKVSEHLVFFHQHIQTKKGNCCPQNAYHHHIALIPQKTVLITVLHRSHFFLYTNMIATLQSWNITHEGKVETFPTISFLLYFLHTRSILNRTWDPDRKITDEEKSSFQFFVMSSIEYIERYYFILFSSIDMFRKI